MNLEFGVSFSNDGPPHTGAIRYTSKKMRERLYRHRRQQEEYILQPRSHRPIEEAQSAGPYPAALLPGPGDVYHNERHHHQHSSRPRRLGIRTRDHERGSSAPPTLSERTQAISPITPVHHASSFPLNNSINQNDHNLDRPLPPIPSRFRLGDSNLPWCTEPWYRPTSSSSETTSEFANPTMVGIELENARGEDPQRVRELEALQQAMMTVDSLANDGWEPWTWESVGDMPRGPRSLGWAVRNGEGERSVSSSLVSPPPPPYVVSQWDEAFGREGWRPRSSG